MEPYKFKKIIFNDGILNKSTDVTYIIHLENNGRYEHIINQLKEYHPTNIIYILFNKGYKKSKKKEFINNPPLDLVDAFLEIFKHANNKNYNNILILEDDFIFSKKIKEKEHIDIINNTINNLGNINFIYYLGCIPALLFPYDLYHYKILISLGTHAIIYSKQNRIDILKINQIKIKDWDELQFKYNSNRIAYCKPLCYQLFTNTDNSNYWGENTPIKFFFKLLLHFLKIIKLNKQVEPGTSICYTFSKILLYSIIFIIIYFIIVFIKKLNIFK